MRARRFAVAIGAVFVIAACGGSEPSASDTPQEVQATTQPTAAPTAEATLAPTTAPAATATAIPDPTVTPVPQLVIEADRLPALAGPAHYEVWLIVEGEEISVGTSSAFGNGVAFDANSLDAASAIVITIETDNDPSPSSSRVLGGPIVDGSAALSVSDPQAIGRDFSSSAGQYILATPTNGTGTPENERSGVWWTFIPRAQSLVLPELGKGWIYEGWQVIDEIAVTTGTFASQFGSPDNAAPYSGPQAGPPFPGEDFLVNAPDGLDFPRDLRGSDVVITIEPFPDTDPGPFPLVVLRGTVPAEAVDHVSYRVDNIAADFPTGLATISR